MLGTRVKWYSIEDEYKGIVQSYPQYTPDGFKVVVLVTSPQKAANNYWEVFVGNITANE